MKYGYMPDFGVKLESEIEFAKKYFDFIEITFKKEKINDISPHIIKNKLKNFPVLGHLDWTLDFSKKDPQQIEIAYDLIRLYERLGVKKITIHPSYGSILNNIISLFKICKICKLKGIKLLVENTANSPFNSVFWIGVLLFCIHGLRFTLDIGHANIDSTKYQIFLFFLKKRLEHIHLHDNIKQIDHIPFKDVNKLKYIIKKIRNSSYDKTITLEIFNKKTEDGLKNLEKSERRKILINHLKIIKTVYN